MSDKIITIEKNGFQWTMEDPFIIAMHHRDRYPEGDGNLGPKVSLAGRNIGSDFSGKDGFSMYHGQRIPGFPSHPHRGFETVTIVLEGVVDHFDSTGSSGRYGNGDVQWLTTGKGCQHSEMFPLVKEKEENPLELFQIWLNLPSVNKFTEPDYKMLWDEQIPVFDDVDQSGAKTHIRLIAGNWGIYSAIKPPKSSWAADPNNHLRIMLIKMEPGATWSLPAVNDKINRNLYFYDGDGHIAIEGESIQASARMKLNPNAEILITNGDKVSSLALLEAKPINEPVVAHGPFVMNTVGEIRQAFDEYQKTYFGGWKWNSSSPVFNKEEERVAYYADGTVDKP